MDRGYVTQTSAYMRNFEISAVLVPIPFTAIEKSSEAINISWHLRDLRYLSVLDLLR